MRRAETKPPRLQAFLSYADNDKNDACVVKEGLEKLGIELFVSHDDMLAGQDWAKYITQTIDCSECFIQLISKNYHVANYTEQEAGMALALRKKIFPITFDKTDPIGFTSKNHCARLDRVNTDYFKLMNSIIGGLGHNSIEWSIDLLSSASNLSDADSIIENIIYLLSGGYLTRPQILKILRIGTSNTQIAGSYRLNTIFKYITDEDNDLITSALNHENIRRGLD